MKNKCEDFPLIIGLHVPKCAGLTILRHVQRHLPAEFIYQNTGIHENFANDRPEFLSIRLKDKLRFVWGHFIHEEMVKQIGHPQIMFTGLRDPVARVQSEVNYLAKLYKALEQSFDPDEYVQRLKHPMCSFFINRFPSIAGSSGDIVTRALKVLECFHLVYFPETFGDVTTQILDILKLPPIDRNENVSTNTNVIEIDKQKLSEDIEFYQEAHLRWGGAICGSGIQADYQLDAIIKTPQNIALLRNFLYSAMKREFIAWNEINDVIEARQKMLDELIFELNYYKEVLALEKVQEISS